MAVDKSAWIKTWYSMMDLSIYIIIYLLIHFMHNVHVNTCIT